jgi:DNA-binding LacI/PurR family transcriptional regulator
VAVAGRQVGTQGPGAAAVGGEREAERRAGGAPERRGEGGLVDLGHRAIAYVDGGKGVIATDRRRGYRTAMRRHGLDARIRVLRGENTEAAGERAARRLLDSGDLPTAVVAYNDQCAIGVLTALQRTGVTVPGEVSVPGYDDDTLSRLSCFDLTTVSQEAQEQARYAVMAAVERLDQGRTVPREVVLTPQLVVRGTIAGPREG